MKHLLLFLLTASVASAAVTDIRGLTQETATGNKQVLVTGTSALAASVTSVALLNAMLSDGGKVTFNPSGTTSGFNVGSQAGDPSAPANGDIWYDSTANELTARINGSNVALGAGGAGATAWNDIGDPTGNNSVALAGFSTAFTSTMDGLSSIIEIYNTDADQATEMSFISLKHNDASDVEVIYLRAESDSDGAINLDYKLAQDSALFNKPVILGDGSNTVRFSLSGDRIYHDTDADGTKDVGEEFIDQSGASVDIDGLAAATEADLDADDKLIISHDGTEKYIQNDNYQDYLESLTWTFATLNATTLNSTTFNVVEGGSIDLDGVLSADGTYSGTAITGTAGATLAFGDLIVLDVTDSRWELADSNSAAAADGDSRGMIGICILAAAADGSATKVLLNGTVRADTAFPTLTVNGQVHISETAGDVTSTSPTTEDAVIRPLGTAITADSIYFNPSGTYQTYDVP